MNDFDPAQIHAMSVAPELLALSRRYAELSEDKRRAFQSRIAEHGIDPWQLPVVPLARQPGPMPLSLAQERLWYLWKLDPDSSAYTISLNVRLDGELSAEQLCAAFDGVMRRHEILRTRFEEREGVAWQIVEPDAQLDWSVHDLSELAAERDAALSEYIRLTAIRPFDLT